MKYISSIIFGLSMSFSLFAQQHGTPDFDHINDYNRQMSSLEQYCNLLAGSKASKAADFPQLLVYGTKGLRLAKKDDHKYKGQFSLTMGIAYYQMARFDSAIYYTKLSAHESLLAKNAPLIAASHASLIPLYMQAQQNGAADSIIEILKSVSDTTKNIVALGKCYFGLGNYYYLKSYYATAQNYFLKGFEISKRLADTSADNRRKAEYALQGYMLYKIYVNSELYDKALAMLKAGSRYMNASPVLTLRYYSAYVEAYTTPSIINIDSALFYYHHLDEMAKSAKGTGSEWVMSNIVVAQYYIRKQDHLQASYYIDKAMSLAQASKAPFLIHQVQNMKGIYKFHTGAYDEAIELFEKALPMSKTVNKGNYLESVHYIAQAYKAKGNLSKAIAYYDIYDKEKDDYTKTNMTRYFADIETQYRTKEKEKEIVLLAEKNKLQRRTTYFLIIGIGLLVIVGFSLYRNNRMKQRNNKKLAQLNNDLEEANHTKAKLFGIISHDLRSPISQVYQFLKLQQLDPDKLDEEQKNRLSNKIQTATGSLLETMEDLLLWSKTQMNQFNTDIQPVDLNDTVSECLQLLQLNSEAKNLKIENSIPPETIINSDPYFLQTILRNLLQNAIKASPQSGQIIIDFIDNKLSIKNHGGHFSQQQYEEVLTSKEAEKSLSGLGLRLVDELSKKINTKVFFRDGDEDSTQVELIFG